MGMILRSNTDLLHAKNRKVQASALIVIGQKTVKYRTKTNFSVVELRWTSVESVDFLLGLWKSR